MQRICRPVLVLVALVLGQACGDEKVTRAPPEIALEQEGLDFDVVRVGKPADLGLTVFSQSRSSLAIIGANIEAEPTSPGGFRAFAVVELPDAIAGESEGRVTVRFSPKAVAEYKAVLVLETDDPDAEDARKRVILSGRGGLPKIKVVASCASPCTEFSAESDPLAIDFGERPGLRVDPLGHIVNEPVWPTVTVSNEGELPLELVRVAFEGDPVFATKQPVQGSGVFIEAGPGESLEVMFDPSEGQDSFEGALIIGTDDPENPEVSVRLTGRPAPNLPPQVCAAIVEVRQPDGSVDYPRDAQGGYSFGAAVPVQPGDGMVMLSAFSDHFSPGLHPDEMARGDQSLCTTDPEDGRLVLEYLWSVVSAPEGFAGGLLGASTPEPAFRADKVGRYVLRLRVTDPQGGSSAAEVAFDALPQRDLAVELSWPGQPGVDLDLHLVKPGPCGGKPDCIFDKRGDLNGYMWARTGAVFDWGEQGRDYDDPRLDLDDQGDGPLLETVSLNRPENDPACTSSSCTYEIYVHFFKDWRAGSPTAPECPGKPCQEGEGCGCEATDAGAGAVCVSGRCVQPARPEVKIFIKPTPDHPEPVLTIPLPPDEVTIGGPCFLWHVARVTWPSREALTADPASPVTVTAVGVPGARSYLYYGSLSSRAFSCAPNTPQGTPDADVTYLPGLVPTYP